MKPLILYPAKRNLLVGAGMGAFLILFGSGGRLAAEDALSDMPVTDLVSLIFVAVGFYLLGACGLRLLSPRPVFEANAEGFRIMGRRLHSWDRFQGVGEHKMRLYFIPLITWVVVKVGKNKMFAGRKHIKWIYLPGKSRNVAEEISAYAWRVRGLNRAQSQGVPTLDAAMQGRRRQEPIDQPPAEAGVVRPARVRPATTATANGPIKDVPTLAQRLFGKGANRL